MSSPNININKRTQLESTRTLIGNRNQVLRELGLPFDVMENSTLNQALNIRPTDFPNQSTYPTIRYYCIGMGGIDFQNCTNTVNGVPYPKIYQHMADDTGLFKIIPFVLRETNNDLTLVERQNYALRRVEEINGVRYYAYYLKRIDMTNVQVEAKIFTKQDDGAYTEQDYIPTVSKMSPQPQVLTPEEENVLSASYGRTVALVPIKFSEQDATELFNVFNVLYNNSELALISEIGLVSGVDKDVTVQTTTGQTTFKEVIAAQLCHINRTLYYLSSSRLGFENNFNLGVNEPLYKIEVRQAP